MSKVKENVSRRDFFKVAGTVGFGAMLSSIDSLSHAQKKSDQKSLSDKLVPTKPFGKSGINIPMLGLGLATMPSHLILKQALKMGVSYWDTARMYGKSEEIIGKYFAKFPEDRKKVFLVTKPSGLINVENLEDSLNRLNTTHVDLYLYHGAASFSELNDRPTQEAVEKMKKEGKIRLFGFSTHKNMEKCLMQAAQVDWIDAIMLTYNYRLMHTYKMEEAVEACANAGIGLTAMKTQAGESYGPVGEETSSSSELIERFTQKGFTSEQAKLKAVWESPYISSICSHMPNMKILMTNTAAVLDRKSLSNKDINFLNKYARETSAYYCAGCAHNCEPAINYEVPISDVMRYLMYGRSYCESDRAKVLFKQLPSVVKNRIAKLNYRKAEQKCPQNMQIGRLMREAAIELA
jgi:predicted aldo/keto reductase-like oxidoreductase